MANMDDSTVKRIPDQIKLALELQKTEMKEWFREEFKQFQVEMHGEYSEKHKEHFEKSAQLNVRLSICEASSKLQARIIYGILATIGGTGVALAMVYLFGGK